MSAHIIITIEEVNAADLRKQQQQSKLQLRENTAINKTKIKLLRDVAEIIRTLGTRACINSPGRIFPGSDNSEHKIYKIDITMFRLRAIGRGWRPEELHISVCFCSGHNAAKTYTSNARSKTKQIRTLANAVF